MFELVENSVEQGAVIRVIGVGGGGGNAVEHMVANSIEGVDFICANTDAQALARSSAHTVLQLGATVTKGLGAGANPEIGRQSALEDRDRIAETLAGTDMLFITAGMGGGTGTGAAPVVAQIAKEMDILTVAVVTKPFSFELRRRAHIADEGIKDLAEYVDSLITVPNEKLQAVLGGRITLKDAFRSANDVLLGAVQGIAELITRPGEINVDFADVRTVMSERGRAMMGSGRATGEDRARHAAERAINCPLLEDVNLRGARGILVNVTAGPDLGIEEFSAVGDAIGEFASDDALVVMGTAFDESIHDELRVTVVATGVGPGKPERAPVEVPGGRRARNIERMPNGGIKVVENPPGGQPVYPTHAHGAPVQPTAPELYGQVAHAPEGVPHLQPQAQAHLGAAQGEPMEYLEFPAIPPTARQPVDAQAQGRARSRAVSGGGARGATAAAPREDFDYLDIPAFLRKQAD